MLMEHVKPFDNFEDLKYFCDNHRHLVCLPYSRENLNRMADDLKIGRHFYDPNPVRHYDIPAKRINEIKAKCTIVSMRTIYNIANGTVTDL